MPVGNFYRVLISSPNSLFLFGGTDIASLQAPTTMGLSTMSKLLSTLLAAAAFSCANLAQAIVITHNTGTFSTNLGANSGSSANFDRAQFMFSAQYVDKITIANAGAGYAHTHGFNGQQMLVSVFNGSAWVNVFSQATPSSVLLSTAFANPINFNGMLISGLRLDSNINVNQQYHDVSNAMTYELTGTPPADVPEPASVALFGAATVAALAARRRKSKPN